MNKTIFVSFILLTFFVNINAQVNINEIKESTNYDELYKAIESEVEKDAFKEDIQVFDDFFDAQSYYLGQYLIPVDTEENRAHEILIREILILRKELEGIKKKTKITGRLKSLGQ